MIILFFGQPASGKTTLADSYVEETYRGSMQDYIRVDGDAWRDLTKNKDYSREGRIANLKSAFTMARFLDNENFTPVLSFVCPYEELRSYLSQENNLVQIYLEYNEERGRNEYFAKDFEEPKGDCLKLNTSVLTISECVDKVKQYILNHRAGF
jgi:adenylylsulfate kinase